MGLAAERGRRRRRLRMRHSMSTKEDRSPHASVVLDYATYPQIIHAIASYACPRTRLALRATSRALRRQLDPEIFKHLVEGTAGRHLFESRTGPLPGQAWRVRTDADQRETWRRRLKYVQVIDQYTGRGSEYLCQLDSGFADAFHDVHTIRWLGGPHQDAIQLMSAEAPTLVSYIDLCKPLYGPSHHEYTDKFEPTPERHVVTIYYDPNASAFPEARLTFRTRFFGPHVVFLFVAHGDCSSSSLVGRSKAFHVRTSLLGGIIELIACARSTYFTVAGIEEIPRRLLGLDESSSGKDVRRAVADTLNSHPQVKNHDTGVSIEFCTLRRYRANVGSTQYKLETEDPRQKNRPPRPPRRLGQIDHLAFPHIMANIVRQAPRESLLQLRSTSHAIKEQVDRILFERVVIHNRSTPPQLLLHSPDCALPCDPLWDDTEYLYCEDESKERMAAPFAHTRVLETRWNMNGCHNDWTPRTAPVRGFLQACANLEAVQHLNSYPSIIPDVTNIIFYCFSVALAPGHEVPQAKLQRGRGDDASRLVVHLLYGPGERDFDGDVIGDIRGPFTCPVVVVLSEWHDLKPEKDNIPLRSDRADILREILRHFMRIATDLTVVGAEHYLRGSECYYCRAPDGPPSPGTDICLCQADGVWDLVREARPHPDEDVGAPPLDLAAQTTVSADRGWPRFLTHDEYAEEVGHEAQLHMEIPSLQTIADGDWHYQPLV